MSTSEKPPGIGWWWWRPHEFDPWVALQVILDPTKGELLVRSDEEHLYQCDGDPEHKWYGEWWPEELSPPSRGCHPLETKAAAGS